MAELVHVEFDCEPGALTDAVVWLSVCKRRGAFDEEQIDRLTPLVNALSEARYDALERRRDG